ncbi:asparaginase [Clostridium grantii]|uniref:L-asparaginase n=1 Tax=Clostridium grantii DSM 8605 TaxID=1121316 RepID=A0A1M5QTJ1_9CLOT|nr:asparaginase [Clostridium grantii]SHH17090.1 L-asparaginase [Clostridium grantii DSM 8605]
MKKIAVIFNGGTISMKIDPRLQAAVPSLSGEEIMSMVTGIEEYANIESFNFSNLPGPHVTPNKMLEMSKYVQNIVDREDIEGVVITHGTDTLEETAYFLHLNIKSSKPIIVTGAMRNGSELGYDGPANLSAAICTAISEDASNKGVLVCMNDELNSAEEVTKVHSMHLNTFQSPEFGPIGIIDNNQVIFYRDILQKQNILTNKIEENVELVKCAAGMNSKIFDFLVESGAKGIVLEGLGRGNVPPQMVDGIKRAIDKGVVVVLVTRCFMGRVLDSYGYEGGGKELRKLGVIFGNNLPGQKARIKLMLALGQTNDYDLIKEIFEKK